MEQFTEVDFYKAILNLQVRATEIAGNNVPIETENGIVHPDGDGGMKQVMDDIDSLYKALAILKQQNN